VFNLNPLEPSKLFRAAPTDSAAPAITTIQQFSRARRRLTFQSEMGEMTLFEDFVHQANIPAVIVLPLVAAGDPIDGESWFFGDCSVTILGSNAGPHLGISRRNERL
jgi:hypothetical protein